MGHQAEKEGHRMANAIQNLVRSSLREMLKTADLATETERSLRSKLEAELGVGLEPHKPLIKEEIEKFIMGEGAGGSEDVKLAAPAPSAAPPKPEPKQVNTGPTGPGGGVKPAPASDGACVDGEVLRLSHQKRVTVDTFKGKLYVGIREFYEKNGKMLPGSKGISMPPPQWKVLFTHVNEIDAAVDRATDVDNVVCSLSSQRKVTVKTFKGNPLVNIREFYEKDGEQKPGKKGIALTAQQWKVLRLSADQINNTVEAKGGGE